MCVGWARNSKTEVGRAIGQDIHDREQTQAATPQPGPQPATPPAAQGAIGAGSVSRTGARSTINNTDIVGQVIGRNDNAVAPSTGLKKLMGA